MIPIPVIILHNTKLDRYHPLFFRMSPRPSATADEGVMRYKSLCHHSEGYATREEAIASIPECNFAGALYVEGRDGVWDGEGIPARIEYFDV